MAYIKRPVSEAGEFFKPDVYISYRSSDSLNDETGEKKQGGVFVFSRKNPETGKYDVREEKKSLEFVSLINLDKLEGEYERSELVRNAYSDTLVIRNKSTSQVSVELKWNNDLRKFIDTKTNTPYEMENGKVRKVLVGELKDTKEIFTLELSGTIAKALMSKNFVKHNLYNSNWDYKLTEQEKADQSKVVELFFNGINLQLVPEDTKVKVGKDTKFKNIFLLKLSGDTNDEQPLSEKSSKAIDLLENQLDKKPTVSTQIVNAGEEITLEDLPF